MRLRTEEISWQEIDGELVILDLRSSRYLAMNETGTFLAGLMAEERSTEELARALAKEYAITDDVATCDVRNFTEALQDKGLLAE
jgi:hypothetical protein